MQPKVRPNLFDTYWRFASERQRVFHRRVQGADPPWTDDPILMQYKFCNVYRASDRVSQYLIRRVIYQPGIDGLDPEDMFLRVVIFRIFSRERTWDALEDATGGVSRRTLDVANLGDLLERLREQQPIYTSAFILAGHNPYGHAAKHRNHLELVRNMFQPGKLGRSLARAKSLRDIYEAILQWPMMGVFMSYQIAIDLNYTSYMSFSEDEFVVPGPGAQRGLEKVFLDDGGLAPPELIMHMVRRQEEEFHQRGIDFQNLFGRRMHAIDAQGLFCEVDKYSRVAFPQLRSNRVRIKQLFRPNREPIELYYPPKWGLNGRLPRNQGAFV